MSSPAPAPAARKDVSALEIFQTFLLIGATSFGGGVVAYLRDGLVRKRGWIDDQQFVEFLSISQTLPGLNATNMAVLVGDKLRGTLGAIVATLGICLPGGLLMFFAGKAYHANAGNPLAAAMLKGAAAAATGLVFTVGMQIGKKSIGPWWDLLIVAATIVGVAFLHLGVLHVLVGVGIVAIFLHRPRGKVAS